MSLHVMVNGCFDVIHVGQVQLREWAAQFGDVFVALNSDASIRRLKGPLRPINDQIARKMVLQALRSVVDVFVFEEDTPAHIIAVLNPDIVVVGPDHNVHEQHYMDAACAGKRVIQAPRFGDYNTTYIVQRLASDVTD